MTVHRWITPDGQRWECDAYDHGPFCRLCRRVEPVTIEQVATAAAEVYKPEGVAIWLDAPNKMLHNATPRQYVEAGDGHQVLAIIDLLGSGGFA